MSQSLATITAIYEAFGKGDVPTILGHMADDVQWEAWADNTAQKAGVPWLQARQGKEGVLAFFQYLGTQMQVKDFQVLSIMDGGNLVAVEFVMAVEVMVADKVLVAVEVVIAIEGVVADKVVVAVKVVIADKVMVAVKFVVAQLALEKCQYCLKA